MSNCGQACPYNTLNGCKVKEYNGICPLTNMAIADFEAVKETKPQTNADRIRAMSDEELARTFAQTGNCPPSSKYGYNCERCGKCWLDYLRQPVKDGDNE